MNNISFNILRSRERTKINKLTLLTIINTRRLNYLAFEDRKKDCDMVDLKNKIYSILEKLTKPSFSSTYNV